MNILVIGGGGREAALCWKLQQSPQVEALYCAPGNAGIAAHAACQALDAGDHGAVIAFCRDKAIDLVVIGPEAPLVAGLADDLKSAGIPAFGPSSVAAQLEGSKGYTKDLCKEASIPTAAYERFTTAAAAKAYLMDQPTPIVIKADGLAAGKGVTIAYSRPQALAAVEDCFRGRFGDAGAEVVIEAFLEGEEASFFALCDGQTALPLATAQDHKAIGDGDEGPNTGGMGAYSPAPVMTQALCDDVMERIITPTMDAMAARGAPFTGVLYAGLMITKEGPELIEYNVRFGDPECQVLMMRLKSDLAPLLMAATKGTLAEQSPEWDDRPALTVVMANKGYPGSYPKGDVIHGLKEASALEDVAVFHAGTALKNGAVTATGGRVLNVTARGDTVSAAQSKAYEAASKICWDNAYMRSDIGWRAVARERDG
ncbi:MAG: phosphoribosylamine--glycine ligase [Pseudomonadota bacterium]